MDSEVGEDPREGIFCSLVLIVRWLMAITNIELHLIKLSIAPKFFHKTVNLCLGIAINESFGG